MTAPYRLNYSNKARACGRTEAAGAGLRYRPVLANIDSGNYDEDTCDHSEGFIMYVHVGYQWEACVMSRDIMWP